MLVATWDHSISVKWRTLKLLIIDTNPKLNITLWEMAITWFHFIPLDDQIYTNIFPVFCSKKKKSFRLWERLASQVSLFRVLRVLSDWAGLCEQQPPAAGSLVPGSAQWGGRAEPVSAQCAHWHRIQPLHCGQSRGWEDLRGQWSQLPLKVWKLWIECCTSSSESWLWKKAIMKDNLSYHSSVYFENLSYEFRIRSNAVFEIFNANTNTKFLQAWIIMIIFNITS